MIRPKHGFYVEASGSWQIVMIRKMVGIWSSFTLPTLSHFSLISRRIIGAYIQIGNPLVAFYVHIILSIIASSKNWAYPFIILTVEDINFVFVTILWILNFDPNSWSILCNIASISTKVVSYTPSTKLFQSIQMFNWCCRLYIISINFCVCKRVSYC